MTRIVTSAAFVVTITGAALVACQSNTELIAKVSNNAVTGVAGGSASGAAGDTSVPTTGAAGTSSPSGVAGTSSPTGAAGTSSVTGTGGGSPTGAAGNGSAGAAGNGSAGASGGATGAAGNGSGAAGTQGTTDAGTAMDGPPANTGPVNVLVFNYTQGYGHQSRITSLPFLKTAAAANNITLDLQYAMQYSGPGQTIPMEGTNDSSQPVNLSAFTTAGGLDKYDVVYFLNTTGHVFQGAQEAAAQKGLQDYMEQHHGGFVGTHSATDTYDENWQWYQDFVGSIYNGHSGVVSGTARYNTGVSHPILSMGGPVPNPWTRNEEWYLFRRDVRGLTDFTVLLLANAPDMAGALAERPSAWVHNVPGGGRVFYTAFGHAVDTFKEAAFMNMLMTGIKWAAHRIP
jgi:type 1 glutamine amidotransferase